MRGFWVRVEQKQSETCEVAANGTSILARVPVRTMGGRTAVEWAGIVETAHTRGRW
jgi:hypothetical protein